MLKNGVTALALFVNVFFFTTLVAGSYPKAQNVTWQSTNFKTLLTWEPKPTTEYSYTVEFSVVNQDREKNKFCIRTAETMCDLTNSLTKLNASYSAVILSEPPLGETSDLIEFPHTRSPGFCPYTDTDIGSPDFNIVQDLKIVKGKRTITLNVSDPKTALSKDNRPLTIRDVFGDDLQYKVTYRKAKSTGQKMHTSKSSEIELPGLDKGESYCFQVQAYIPSRVAKNGKQLGTLSLPKCSHNDNTSFFEEFSVGVIAGGILLILAVVLTIIGVGVCCVRRTRNRDNPRKVEVEPLNV